MAGHDWGNELKVIWQREAGASGIIRLIETRFDDKKYYDLRRWYRGADGKVLPTRKGVRFNAEWIPELIAALTMTPETQQESQAREDAVKALKDDQSGSGGTSEN